MIELHCGDCLEIMRAMPDRSVDLVFTSPPYENARLYSELKFKLVGQAWVDWMFARISEMCRICKGPVFVNCEGKTRGFRWSATPVLLMADLHRAGFNLRKPPIFNRVGVPGSGGPDWWRNDYEFVIAITPPGKLEWSDNTADGHPPKWGPGGEMSYRDASGDRRNQWGGTQRQQVGPRDANGVRQKTGRPSHVYRNCAKQPLGTGENLKGGCRSPMPAIANPGNVFKESYTTIEVAELIEQRFGECGDVQECLVGGGHMGSKIAHENEAPFPEDFAERYIRSFCPVGGTVLDPFSGSGTTVCVAERCGRNGIGIDIRESEIAKTRRRMKSIQKELI